MCRQYEYAGEARNDPVLYRKENVAGATYVNPDKRISLSSLRFPSCGGVRCATSNRPPTCLQFRHRTPVEIRQCPLKLFRLAGYREKS